MSARLPFACALGGVFVVGVSVRSQTTPVELYLQAAVVAVLAAFALYLAFATAGPVQRSNASVPELTRVALIVWLIGVTVFGYGMLLSIEGGWSTTLGVALAVRYTPLFLIPVFVYVLRTDLVWRRALTFFVVLGTVSAVVDLMAIDVLDTRLTRLVSGDFHGVYHQYALIVAVMLLGTGAVRDHSIRWLLILALPLLLWRTLLSLSRGPVVIIALSVLYALAVSTRLRPGVLAKRAAFLLATLAVAWIPLRDLSRTRLADAYEFAFATRASFTYWSLRYRVSELVAALEYGGLAGQGWGSAGDFSEAVNYTTAARAVAVKAYVHNLFGFAWWKLGVLGGALVIAFLVFTLVHIRRSARIDDRTGLVVGGVLLMWFLHSMVNMDFARAELNLVVAASVAYFVSRSMRGEAFFDGRDRGYAGRTVWRRITRPWSLRPPPAFPRREILGGG